MLTRFSTPSPPTTEREVMALIERLSVKPPADYVEFLIRHNGGRPQQRVFPIEGFEGNPIGGIQAFFGVATGVKTWNLDWVLRSLSPTVPLEIFPIAQTDSGDYLVLDLNESPPPVLFWDRVPYLFDGDLDDRDLYPIAKDFATFLNELRDDE